LNVKILGAHNTTSRQTGGISLLIDSKLAIDAGSLATTLTLKEQQRLKAVLLSHQHYDHVRDIPALGMSFLLARKSLTVATTQPVYDVLTTHLLNDTVYPRFFERPPEDPVLRFQELTPGREAEVAGYRVLPVPVHHAVPTVGYQVTAPDGKRLFYSGDTGPGLAECWKLVSPQLLVADVTGLNKYGGNAGWSGHLTTDMLREELESFRKLHGYLPRVVAVHMNVPDVAEIKTELAAAAASLGAEIEVGYEGMEIEI
jgi:ribonuclease BN (tRNA processing enzyme)